SIDGYFRKIESIATILTNLGSLVSSEDVVNLALEGLPDKYDNVCGIIHHQEHFLNLKTARSMLTTEELLLKSKSQSLPVDSLSSSPMVLMAKSGITGSGSNTFAHSNVTGGTTVPLVQNTTPVAYHTNVSPTGFLPGLVQSHIYSPTSLPGCIQTMVQPTGLTHPLDLHALYTTRPTPLHSRFIPGQQDPRLPQDKRPHYLMLLLSGHFKIPLLVPGIWI
ncbi:hypothetical protein Tco_1574258, partial [Tanacetum coccineum]